MEAVFGINPIKVLLASQDTPLKRIIIAEGRSGSSVKEIIEVARQKKVPVEWRRRQSLDELTDEQTIRELWVFVIPLYTQI